MVQPLTVPAWSDGGMTHPLCPDYNLQLYLNNTVDVLQASLFVRHDSMKPCSPSHVALCMVWFIEKADPDDLLRPHEIHKYTSSLVFMQSPSLGTVQKTDRAMEFNYLLMHSTPFDAPMWYAMYCYGYLSYWSESLLFKWRILWRILTLLFILIFSLFTPQGYLGLSLSCCHGNNLEIDVDYQIYFLTTCHPVFCCHGNNLAIDVIYQIYFLTKCCPVISYHIFVTLVRALMEPLLQLHSPASPIKMWLHWVPRSYYNKSFDGWKNLF